jgi:hypothetical protein
LRLLDVEETVIEVDPVVAFINGSEQWRFERADESTMRSRSV